MSLNQTELKTILDYDPETGAFTWKHRANGPKWWNTRWAGKAAGSTYRIGNTFYTCIRISGQKFYAHRLAWFYVYGEWPQHEIDHRDRDGTNNRLSNMRPATRTLNKGNQRRRKDNTHGFKGARRCRSNWQASISKDGVRFHLGTFSSPELAHEAYVEAAKKLYGEFARRA